MSVCTVCGKEFVPARFTKFCSVQCYKKYWYIEKTKNARKICPTCGKEFHPDSDNRNYCSPDCRKEGKRRLRRLCRAREYNKTGHAPVELVERVCPVCGQTFTPKKTYQRYCCKKCRKTDEKTKRNAMREHTVVVLTRQCAWCGKEFTSTKKNKRCCSKECSYTFNKHKCSLEELEKRRAAKREAAIARAAEKAIKVNANGLTDAQIKSVVDAQDGDPSLLWSLSQNWTPAQRKYAKARYESRHGLFTQTFYG